MPSRGFGFVPEAAARLSSQWRGAVQDSRAEGVTFLVAPPFLAAHASFQVHGCPRNGYGGGDISRNESNMLDALFWNVSLSATSPALNSEAFVEPEVTVLLFTLPSNEPGAPIHDMVATWGK